MKYLQYIAIAGNVLFLLFFLHNAIDEGTGNNPVQTVAEIGMTILLILNLLVLLLPKKRHE